MPQILFPWPSLLLPVSQSLGRLEVSVTSGVGSGFGRVLKAASKVFGGMEGNFFFPFSAVSHLQNRGSCCAALTPVWSRLMRGQEIQQSKSRVG